MPYVKPTWIAAAASTLMLVGTLWAIGAVAYLINGLTRTGAGVEITVVATTATAEDLRDALQDALPESTTGVAVKEANVSEISLSVWDSTALEQFVGRLDTLLTGLAVLAGAFLLSRLLATIAAGEPFASGNPRRLALLAGIVFTHSLLYPFPDRWTAHSALERAGFGEADSALQAYVPPLDLFDLVVMPFGLLVLAEAFRRGRELRRDVDGLI